MASRVSFGPRFHPRTAPVTFGYLVISAALMLIAFFSGRAGAALLELLLYHPATLAQRPWTLLTDPFVNYTGPFWLLLLGYVVWWVGAELEGWWGSRIQAGFLIAMALGAELGAALGAAINPAAGYPVSGLGARPLLCGLFTVWALRNPRQSVLLLFVRVTGMVLIILEIAMTWWSYGPYYGLFVVLGTAGLAALYYHKGEVFHQMIRRKPSQPRRTREETEREQRFRRIIEQSGLHLVEDDEDDSV